MPRVRGGKPGVPFQRGPGSGVRCVLATTAPETHAFRKVAFEGRAASSLGTAAPSAWSCALGLLAPGDCRSGISLSRRGYRGPAEILGPACPLSVAAGGPEGRRAGHAGPGGPRCNFSCGCRLLGGGGRGSWGLPLPVPLSPPGRSVTGRGWPASVPTLQLAAGSSLRAGTACTEVGVCSLGSTR